MAEGQTDQSVLADRVATMNADATVRQGNAINWPMIVSIAAIAFFSISFAVWALSDDSTDFDTAYLAPQNSITSDDRRESGSSLFGDTDYIAPVPEPNAEVEDLKKQLAALVASLDAPAPTTEMPEAYKAELAKMREQIASMEAGFQREISGYQTYITELEARFETSARLPPRPVSLQDSKWVRAQQLNSNDENGETARRAAPSLVFDGSKRKSDEDDEDEQLIIEQFGRTFPTSEELTPPPQ